MLVHEKRVKLVGYSYPYCGSWILALEFFMSFSLSISLGRATAGVHCREEL